MPKVLFHYSVLNRGGAEQSTLRLIKMFISKGWDVTLVLNIRGGSLESEIPPDVKVEYLSNFTSARYLNRFSRVILRGIDRITYPFRCLKFKKENYDLAFVGLQGLDPKFVCNTVNAENRGIFIRNDISLCSKNEKVISNLNKFKDKLDRIICVSETAKESVDALLPGCSAKTQVIYNIINADEMRSKCLNAENPYKPSPYVKVVSVSRMVDKAKGLFRMLDAYDELYNRGVIFEWYFVGDGPDLPAMRDRISGKPYEGIIHFEGEKKNPFPYYKYADLVAVLSYYEGLCGVVNEAKISGAAVIATEFSGIHEQISHGQNGWIVDNDLDSVIKGLELLVLNDDLRSSLRNTDYPEEIVNDENKFAKISKV